MKSLIALVSSTGFPRNLRQSGLSSYRGSGTFPLARKSSITVGSVEDLRGCKGITYGWKMEDGRHMKREKKKNKWGKWKKKYWWFPYFIKHREGKHNDSTFRTFPFAQDFLVHFLSFPTYVFYTDSYLTSASIICTHNRCSFSFTVQRESSFHFLCKHRP